MKKILLMLLMIIPIASAIGITGFINDHAGILTDADKQQIEPILQGLYDQDLAEFSVVTVPSLEGRDIEGYAFELAEGRLGKKDKNNGLLLLVALEDRKYRFEVGRGLEPILPDGKIGRVGRTYLVENFKQEEYGKGVKEAVLAVQAILTENAQSEYYVSEVDPEAQKWAMIGMIIALVMFTLFIIIIIKAAKHGKKRGDSDYFWAALIAGNMMRGKGGFSGGFGGFGGGSFGGGGASGGW